MLSFMASLPDSDQSQTQNMTGSRRLSKKVILFVALIVFILLVGIFVIYPQFTKRRAQSAAADAQNQYKSGDFKAASKNFEESLKFDSTNPKILADTILAIASEGNRTGKESDSQTRAASYIEKARAYQKDTDILTALGYMAETNGRYQEASDYYQKALVINANSADLWFHKAHALEFLGKTQDAYNAYNKAYQIDQKHPLVLQAEGREALAKNKTADAYNFFLNAFNNTDNNSLKAENLAAASAIKRSQGYFAEAQKLATMAVNYDRNYVPGLTAYGVGLALDGDYKKAVAFIDEGIHKNPRIVQSYWSMAMVLRMAKQYDDSIRFFKDGIAKIDNDNTLVGDAAKVRLKSEMTYDLARTYATKGDTDSALPLLETAVGLDKNLGYVLTIDLNRYDYFKGLAANSRFAALLR